VNPKRPGKVLGTGDARGPDVYTILVHLVVYDTWWYMTWWYMTGTDTSGTRAGVPDVFAEDSKAHNRLIIFVY